MKKLYFFLCCLCGVSIILTIYGCRKHHLTFPPSLFYYSFSEKIFLNPVNNQLIVRFTNASPDSLRSQINQLKNITASEWPDSLTVILTTNNETVQQDLLEKFRNNKQVVSVYPMFKLVQGGEVGLTNQFTVQFRDNVPLSKMEELNKIYHVTIISKSFFYLLQVAPKENALNIANIYYKTGLTIFSCPDFITKINLD